MCSVVFDCRLRLCPRLVCHRRSHLRGGLCLHFSVRVGVCACACVGVCVCARVRVCMCVCMCVSSAGSWGVGDGLGLAWLCNGAGDDRELYILHILLSLKLHLLIRVNSEAPYIAANEAVPYCVDLCCYLRACACALHCWLLCWSLLVV